MKVRFVRLDRRNSRFTTVGYWAWSQPGNKGTLTIEVAKLPDLRFELAVWGHEIIEALYCKLFGVTTEAADAFDELYERMYATGEKSPLEEAGDDRACPYHWGHMAGVVWEYVCIYGTLASWPKYAAACNAAMDIK